MKTNFFAFVAFVLLWAGLGLTSVSAQSFYSERYDRNQSIALGIGPSFMYSDNGGIFSASDFQWNPSLGIAYAKKVMPWLAIHATAGIQAVQSGGPIRDYAIEKWEESGGAFRFKGNAFYADLMPVVYLLPYDSHMNRGKLNIYIGSGVGVVHVARKEAFSFDPNAEEFAVTTTTMYIPVMLGISYAVGPLTDLALETKGMFTFSDELDGNVGYNQFNDHLFQSQIVIRRLLRNRLR